MISQLGFVGRYSADGDDAGRNVGHDEGQIAGPEATLGLAESFIVRPGMWQLHRARECRSRRLGGFDGYLSASLWLQGYRKDALSMTALRAVLVEEGLFLSLTRPKDEEVIEQVAHLLNRGVWHVCEAEIRAYRVLVAQEPAVAPVPRRGPVQSESSAPPVNAPDAPTLAPNADQAAIAAVLAGAAKSGAAICEECAKAARGGSR